MHAHRSRNARSGAPHPLREAVLDWDYMHKYWTRLRAKDQERYITWVANARSQRQARRRARTVHDRVLQGQPWAGPVRRFFDNWTIPSPSPIPGPNGGEIPFDLGAGTPGIN